MSLVRPVQAAALALLAVFLVKAARADEAPGDCLGVGFNRNHPALVAKIVADQPRLALIKNASDDKSCPADGAACAQSNFLAPGDLVLVGKTHGDFTCVARQSASGAAPLWTAGWLPAVSIAPVEPMAQPSRGDWLGHWVRPGADIRISPVGRNRVTLRGRAVASAPNARDGVVAAVAKPAQGLIAFADRGRTPFDKADLDVDCLMRMQRVEALLVVEDNGHCGGALVSFTGFYKKKR